MSAYGIAGFADGFMGGVDKAHQWKDRKRNQARQDKLDGMTEAEHERRMRILDQQIAGTDRAVSDAAEVKGIFGGAVDATNAAMNAPGAPPPGSPPVNAPDLAAPGATSGLPPPAGILPMGIPTGPTNGGRAAAGMPSPEQLRANAAPGAVNAPVVGGPMNGPGPAVAQQPGRTAIVPPQAMPDNPVLVTQGPGPTGAGLEELYDQGILPRRYQEDPFQKTDAAKAAEADRATQSKAFMDEMFLQNRARGDEYVPTEIRDAARAEIAGRAPPRAPGPPLAEQEPRLAPGPANAAPGGMGLPQATGKAPASAPGEVKALADTAATAMAQTTTPAMEATAAAASRGLPKPSGTSEAARTRAAGDFMDHYREVGAPMVIEALIKRGDIEKAVAFQEFLDRGETKAGMENWAKAAFAATVGDMDTFATEIMEAYDRLDYFPDGTTIVRDESGFTRDRQGNITGAKLTFKDEATGNTFDQVFSDPNDLVKMGITLLAPEEAFEYYYEQQAAAAASAKGVKDEADAEEKARQSRVDGIAKTIFDKSVGLDGKPTITYAEAIAQAEAAIAESEGAAAPGAGGPPVARRPEG